nr:probable protein phosphatase 2C 2 [Ipomoea trifida]
MAAPSPLSSTPSPLSPFALRLPTQTGGFGDEAPVFSATSSSPLTAGVSTPTAVLKRKRPARIDIPTPCLNFEHSVQTPGGDKVDEVEDEGEGYAVYCKRGKKGAMEDRHSAAVDLQEGSNKPGIFGVFDGHGGAKAAEFAARNLGKNIMHEVVALSSKDGGGVEAAVREGYLTTDEEFVKQNVKGGACCVTALIHEGNLVVSNAGDCRAVMSRGGVAEALTVDHRPSREDERERVESLGGYVSCCRDVWRIQGCLAVSRGIGDSHLKKWVIAEPETRTLPIEPGCEFLILASDGIWEKIKNQEAVDTVRRLCVGVDDPKPFFACKELVDLAVTRGSIDDMSAMVILLDRFV